MRRKSKAINAVDLFCGAGGLTCGLREAGINVKAGFDIDPSCKFAYEHNNPSATFILKSVSDVTEDDLAPYFSEGYSLLSGCAPCQTFSAINPGVDSNDERWWLLDEFARLVSCVRPDFVTMENVPGLMKHTVFKNFIKKLQEEGYGYDYKVINCSDYGIPQNRRRLVLVAAKDDRILFPDPSALGVEKRTVRDAIGSMDALTQGSSSSTDPVHSAKGLREINLKRIQASRPGGSWLDWDDELRCECHRKSSGRSYTAVYGRMSWDKPSPTITTQFYNYGSGRFGHPEQDRALSFREGALLQTFPPDYVFFEDGTTMSDHVLGRLIGNSVPVDLGKIIGDVFVARIGEAEKQSIERGQI